MKWRMPDHSIIVTEINVGENNDHVSEGACLNREQANTSGKKYSFDNMPVNLMKSGPQAKNDRNSVSVIGTII